MDDSHEMSRLVFSKKNKKHINKKLSSAAVVIGALRIKTLGTLIADVKFVTFVLLLFFS